MSRINHGTKPHEITEDEIWIQRIETGGFFCQKESYHDAHKWCEQAYVRGAYRTVRVPVTRVTCCGHIVEFGLPTPLDRP